jgi:hypothetical protein
MKRMLNPIANKRSASRDELTILRASAAFIAKGFSQMTLAPALKAARTISSCVFGIVQTLTRSIAWRSKSVR